MKNVGDWTMDKIRLITEKEACEIVMLFSNAYPSAAMNNPETRKKLEERILVSQTTDQPIKYYGCFKDDRIVGGMCFHNFTMNLRSTKISAGGLGGVAVDLLHKKEKVARDMVAYFHEYYRKNGYAMTMLYPFRPDFYKKMGYGIGTKFNQYKLKPAAFPKYCTKEHLFAFKPEDKQLLIDCYERIVENRHGMSSRPSIDWDNMTANVDNRIMCYKNNGRIEGYMIFTFKRVDDTSILKNNMAVSEMLYENTEALQEMLYFFHTQDDQIYRIVINLPDEDFHYLFHDPRDDSDNLFSPVYHETNIQGVGLMYRVVDIKRLFELLHDVNFGNQNLKLSLNINDTFLPENSGKMLISFINGRPSIMENGEYDAEISMDISDFSSMVMGSVGFKSLLRYGIAQISDSRYVNLVHQLFITEEKPMCLVAF